jgi:hypothetical protein
MCEKSSYDQEFIKLGFYILVRKRRVDGYPFARCQSKWLFLATTIFGHGDTLVVLSLSDSALFFLDCGRIFLCFDATINVAIDPSGLVPSAGSDGRV